MKARVETAANEAHAKTTRGTVHLAADVGVGPTPTFRSTSGGGPSKRGSGTLPTYLRSRVPAGVV